MLRTAFSVLVLVLMGSACTTPLAPFRTGVVRDVVLFQFKPTAPPREVEAVVQRFLSLPDEIPDIQSIEGGYNISPEKLSEGYTHVFVLTFRNQMARNAYLKHPARAEFVLSMADPLEKCIVIDYFPFDRDHRAAPVVAPAKKTPAAPAPVGQP
jgi:hypothetical protein